MNATFANPSQTKKAIDQSRSSTGIVTLEVYDLADVREVVSAAKELGYEVDFVEEEPGKKWDVWGWTDETPANSQDWRLKVVYRDNDAMNEETKS